MFVCFCGIFTPDVCVWGANAFCYLPFGLKEGIHTLESFVGSNDASFVQTFQTDFFPFEFVIIVLSLLKFSTKRTLTNVHRCWFVN